MMKARGVTVWKRAARGRAASRLCAALACLAFVASSDCAAQGRARGGGLPRVGTIKDYPATGLTVGCGNIYSHLPRHAGAPDSRLVFISNSEGGNAWMNFDGRDVRLRQIKPARRSRGGGDRPYNYRVGTLRVSVHFEELRPGDPLFSEDFMFKLRITLRRGRAARTVRAVGYADC